MKKFVFCIVVFLLPFTGSAQTDGDKMVSSLIVAVDVRPGIVKGCWNTSRISEELDQMLLLNDIKVDFVAGELYGIKKGVDTPDDFARLITTATNQAIEYKDILQLLHDSTPGSVDGPFFSITSFAKPYSLLALKDLQATNRTYVAIITDGKYNGNDDYYGEVEYVKNDFSAEGRKQFLQDIKSVQTNYFCNFIAETKIKGGYIQLYEFIPLQQYFALESVIDFPHEVTAHRTKKGYNVVFSMTEVPNKDYQVQKVILSLQSENDLANSQALAFDNSVTLPLSKEEAADARIELKAWVKLYDGVYNNTVLHPDGSKLQGADGLNRSIRITKEPQATILGIIPLSDFLFTISFWTSSQTIAANVWGWIFIVILLLIIASAIIMVIYKSNIYVPNLNEVKI